ncbi:hypothetical protein H9P43_009108 [Blastocladiella emersonii ATCC 22665]|nr:hypothetical protein H9P43_009108 [Blastocladiella emersonii ATCC 22665]
MGGPAPSNGSGARPPMGRHLVTDEMIAQVLAMFPDLDRADVRADLSVTGAVEATVERVLAGTFYRSPPPAATTTATPANGAARSRTAVDASKPSATPAWSSLITNASLAERRAEMVARGRAGFLAKHPVAQ